MSAERWEFYLDARGQWCWRRVHPVKGIVSDSKRCFRTREDCIADAVKHGYLEHRMHRRNAARAKCARVPPARQDRGHRTRPQSR